MHTIERKVRVPREWRWLMYVIAAVLVSPLATPAPARAVDSLKECMDKAWKDYNTCLVEAGTSKWQKSLCDLYFSADGVLCAAKYVGDVKNSAESGSGEAY